jgi:hypothetical protein
MVDIVERLVERRIRPWPVEKPIGTKSSARNQLGWSMRNPPVKRQSRRQCWDLRLFVCDCIGYDRSSRLLIVHHLKCALLALARLRWVPVATMNAGDREVWMTRSDMATGLLTRPALHCG